MSIETFERIEAARDEVFSRRFRDRQRELRSIREELRVMIEETERLTQ